VSLEFNVIYQVLSSDATQGDSWSDLLLTSSYLYRMFLCFLLQLSIQCTGILLVTTLAYTMLSMLSMHSIYLGISMTVFASLLGSLFGLVYIDQLGRRFTLIVGSIGVSCCWLSMAICIQYGGFLSNKPEIFYSAFILRFIFASLLCLFSFMYSLSYGIVAYVVPVEIFPMRLRAKASAINMIFNSLSNIVAIIFLDAYLRQQSSLPAVFLTFAFSAMLLGFCLWIGLPETKGLMLENMEDLFLIDSQELCCYCCPCCYYDSPLQTLLPTPSSSTAALNTASGYGSIAQTNSSIAKRPYTPGSTRSSHAYRGSALHLMGWRVIPQEQLLQNILVRSNKSSLRQPIGTLTSSAVGPVSNELLEPTMLHKYSHDMRELKFEFFPDEAEPLVRNQASSPTHSFQTGSKTSAAADNASNMASANESQSFYSYIAAPVSTSRKTPIVRSFASSLIPEPVSTGNYGSRTSHKLSSSNL
jgi:hypothetical protein